MDEKPEPFIVPVIETRRLVLRPVVETDIPFLHAIFSREETNVHTEYDTISTMEEAKQLYELYCVPKPSQFRHALVLRQTGETIGTMGLYGYTKRHKAAIVGYDLMKEHWGKGYATEALSALADHVFAHADVNRIEGTIDSENIGSRRVLEKCGFAYEGTARQKFFYRGAFHDDIVFSLLREDWLKAKGAQPA